MPAWERELEGDEDAAFLLGGVAHGFDIVNSGHILQPVSSQNHLSARLDPEAVNKSTRKSARVIMC